MRYVGPCRVVSLPRCCQLTCLSSLVILWADLLWAQSTPALIGNGGNSYILMVLIVCMPYEIATQLGAAVAWYALKSIFVHPSFEKERNGRVPARSLWGLGSCSAIPRDLLTAVPRMASGTVRRRLSLSCFARVPLRHHFDVAVCADCTTTMACGIFFVKCS